MSDEPLDLGPIKARCEATIPGPWKHAQHPPTDDHWVEALRVSVTGMVGAADAEFIARARQDVPALIAEVEALREGMHAYTEHASRWKRERDEARAIIERAHHESIAGDGRSSVVLAVVREILSSADLSTEKKKEK